jgi:GT2 family glycosyltransferase
MISKRNIEKMNPFFSVIIPTYKRKARLWNCLEAISQLSYPKDRFEVIVVDDSNDHGMTSFLLPFYDQLQLVVLSQKNAGPAAARNKGRKHARGEYLIFTDDDCVPALDWLNAFAQCVLKTPNCAITGKTVNALTGNLYSTASQLMIDYFYDYYNFNSGDAKFAVSSNLAMPAEGFDAIGGFDIMFTRPAGEDRDLCARWREHGFRIIYAPEVIVWHHHTLSISSFLKQHVNYGCGAYSFHQKRSGHNFNYNKLESLKFYINLLSYPLSQPLGKNRFGLVFLLALSQVSTCAGYLIEEIRSKEKRNHFVGN